MQNGDTGRAANGQLPGANFGPKYEQHVAEMQKQVEEANQKYISPLLTYLRSSTQISAPWLSLRVNTESRQRAWDLGH